MKFSISIGKREFALAFGEKQKLLAPDLQAWARGDDIVETDQGAKLITPYMQSVWIYCAISILAQNLSQIPFRISRVSGGGARKIRAWRGHPEYRAAIRSALGEEILDRGPAVELFEQPHPSMDRTLFFEMLVTWLSLRGEFFVVPLDAEDQPVDLAMRAPKVSRLITLPPELFWHVVIGYKLEAWRYTGSPLLTPIPSEMLTPTEVIHSRTPNPYLYWRGMSPLLVAMLPASADYAAAMFQKGLLMNNADTGIIATTDQNLTQEQREQFMAALRERKRKAGTPDRPLFLSNGVKIEKPTISNVDMQFLETRNLLRQEILAIYKVPQIMCGFVASRSLGTGQGEEQERYSFIENTITPLCHRIEAALAPVIRTFGDDLVGWFDVESLPVMQEARRTRVDSAAKVFALGVPFNEVNKVYDLGFTDVPWGSKGYLPLTLQEAGDLNPSAELEMPSENPNVTGDEGPIGAALKFLEKVRKENQSAAKPTPHVCAAPNGYEKSIAGAERMLAGRMQKFFFEQRGRVLARLAKRGAHLATVKSFDDLWDEDEENRQLHKKIDPVLQTSLEFGGAQLMQEIGAGVDFSMPPTEALEFLAKRKPMIDGINATTWEDLKSSLSEGLAAGESTAQLAARVKSVFTAASDYRAWVIAMTETNIAVNTGRFSAMKQAGIQRKGWLTAHLETTRATHLRNEMITKNEGGIPIDDLWPNGLSYPGDPAGAPGETINCHCVGYAMPATGESGFSVDKMFLTFEQFLEFRHGK